MLATFKSHNPQAIWQQNQVATKEAYTAATRDIAATMPRFSKCSQAAASISFGHRPTLTPPAETQPNRNVYEGRLESRLVGRIESQLGGVGGVAVEGQLINFWQGQGPKLGLKARRES